MRRSGVLLLLLAGCAAGRVAPVAAPPVAPAQPAEVRLDIPLRDEAGASQTLAARLCRPAGDGPHRLVVVAHGAPPLPEDAPRMVPTSCGSGPARWFTARGYAVLFALRRGMGASTGVRATHRFCAADDLVEAGLHDARDIAGTVAFGRQLAGIDPSGTVVVGQSTGGWGTMALESVPHPPVARMVVMAGGRGGKPYADLPRCPTGNLAAAAARFGAAARTPMLWVYARNDRYFGPPVAVAMHDAFVAAGGRAALEQPPPFGDDGHRLFYGPGGTAVWGPLVARYLETP